MHHFEAPKSGEIKLFKELAEDRVDFVYVPSDGAKPPQQGMFQETFTKFQRTALQLKLALTPSEGTAASAAAHGVQHYAREASTAASAVVEAVSFLTSISPGFLTTITEEPEGEEQ